MSTRAPARIDFDLIRRAVNLRRFVEADLGPPLRHGRWACPIHGGEGPNFAVEPDGQRFRCWTCGARGDVLDYLVAREGITLAEAAARLDPTTTVGEKRPRSPRGASGTIGPRETRTRTVDRASGAVGDSRVMPVWSDPTWQSWADRVIGQAEACLWSREGRPVRAWLRARGLHDTTVRRFRLGFLPRPEWSEPIAVLGHDEDGRVKRAVASRGVVFPWVRPGAWFDATDGACELRWVGANVRRLPEGNDLSLPVPKGRKYLAFAGSERGHGYPWPEAMMPGKPALLCEGELDGLTAWQEAGWLANAVSFGGASQTRLSDDARAFLARCPDWLLLFDFDDAGDRAAKELLRRYPGRARRLYLPPGVNDLNDLHRSGASVRDWLRSEFARFGWPDPDDPATAAARPIRVHNPETHLAGLADVFRAD